MAETQTTIDAQWKPVVDKPTSHIMTTPAPTPPLAMQTLANQLSSKPNLVAALVKAIASCQAVPHDATNTFHRYKYTSAEAIITEARQALATHGLAVIPVEQTVNGHDREGPDRYELVQQRLLLHVSGESILCSSVWPIIPDKGRPLDKATAAADTTSLAYFFRDLLMLPRVDPDDDVAGRDDRNATPPPVPAKPTAPAKAQTEVSKQWLTKFQKSFAECKSPADVEAVTKSISDAIKQQMVADDLAALRVAFKAAVTKYPSTEPRGDAHEGS